MNQFLPIELLVFDVLSLSQSWIAFLTHFFKLLGCFFSLWRYVLHFNKMLLAFLELINDTDNISMLDPFSQPLSFMWHAVFATSFFGELVKD